MGSLSSLTKGLTCSPNNGIVKLVPLRWSLHTNNIINIKQVHSLRSYKTLRKISQDVKVFAASQNSVEQIQSGLGLNCNAENVKRGSSYLFRTELGGLMKVLVGFNNMKYSVLIEASSLPHSLNEHDLILSWGIFRTNSSHLDVPNFQTFIQDSHGNRTIMLEFDSSQTPFYLSFLLHSALNLAPTDSGIRTHRKARFCVPVGIRSGRPMPLGISSSKDGSTNFALFSKNAESVILCLYASNSSQPSLEIELDPYVNRTGAIWHVLMEGCVGNYVSYGYRCKGEENWNKGVILDPYAKLIRNFFLDKGEAVSLVQCLGCLDQAPTFDWNGDVHPKLPMEKLVIYRLNVGNFTKDKSSALPENVAGTFTGVSEKLQHFISLGVNAVLLEPIFSFDKQKGPYFPYHFFSPKNSYGATNSMKEMVKTLHAHGIEVLLEVVFTHTNEVISFRGIDKSSYYIVEGEMESGIDNAVKCNNPIVQQLILDSLQYWRTEFHVDGFCFINSSFLLRDSDGNHLSRPPLVESIAFDPLLCQAKIIADCRSPVDMSYVDNIHFPHWRRWAEMNPRYCRDVRNFLRGEGILSNLATRLCGSGDIFSDSRGPAFSFNFITNNFGLPLVDLVSFSSDELSSELSWNCGEEGLTNDVSVLEIRLRQIQNFLFMLFVSLGVPVLNMGDECGFSTGGLSSYYNRQPINWNGVKTTFGKQVTRFISFLSSLRVRRNDLFQKRDFLKVENIDWHGSEQSEPNWEDPSCRFLAMRLIAEKDDKGDLFICFNASELPESAILPQLSEGYYWFRLVDTSLPFPGFFLRDSDPIEALSAYELKPHCCALFEAEKRDRSIEENLVEGIL